MVIVTFHRNGDNFPFSNEGTSRDGVDYLKAQSRQRYMTRNQVKLTFCGSQIGQCLPVTIDYSAQFDPTYNKRNAAGDSQNT